MCTMQQIIQPCWNFEESSAKAHQRKVADLQQLHPLIQTSWISKQTHAYSQWSKTTPQCSRCNKSFNQAGNLSLFSYSHRREATPMHQMLKMFGLFLTNFIFAYCPIDFVCRQASAYEHHHQTWPQPHDHPQYPSIYNNLLSMQAGNNPNAGLFTFR